MLLEAEAFYSLPRLPENSILLILLKETYRILPILHSTQKNNSTTRNLPLIHSFMQYTSVYLQDLPRHSRYSTGLHPNPAFFN